MLTITVKDLNEVEHAYYMAAQTEAGRRKVLQQAQSRVYNEQERARVRFAPTIVALLEADRDGGTGGGG